MATYFFLPHSKGNNTYSGSEFDKNCIVALLSILQTGDPFTKGECVYKISHFVLFNALFEIKFKYCQAKMRMNCKDVFFLILATLTKS